MKRSIQVEDVDLGRFHAPDHAGSLPGLVLIHDVWGLSPHSRALASDLAGEGFGVLEIDLYRDRDGPPTADPGSFIRSLPDLEILADLDRAAEWLGAHPVCRDRRIGVVGVCMGGTYALLAACTSTRFYAAAPFYGILSYDEGMLAAPDGRDRELKPRSPIEAAEALRMPLFASFGCDDEFVPAADVDRLEVELARSDRPYTVDRHERAGHAFLNKMREPAFRPEASKRAWSRVIPFLEAELQGEVG